MNDELDARRTRREDGQRLAALVRSDECGGLHRAEVAHALGWAEDSDRFRAAMFYARAAAWITFCGNYLCHPGPAAPLPPRAACPRPGPPGQQGALDISEQTTPATRDIPAIRDQNTGASEKLA